MGKAEILMSINYDEPQAYDAPASATTTPYTVPPTTPPPAPTQPPSHKRSSHRGRDLLAAAGLTLVLVGAGIELAPPATPGHQLLSTFTSLTSSGPLAALAQARDPQSAAVQKVVQTANDEQAQAIAAQDPSAMSDTATAAHYQQLVQVNQDMLNQGVTSIRLTNLTWGPINVNGTTATATTNETWTTTFSDGTTTQSTDTNNYALVQQDGKWLIQDDQQPTASAPAGQPSALQQPSGQQPSGQQPSGQQPGPRISPRSPAPGREQPNPQSPITSNHSTSQNWSGYAATQGQYTSVSGTWTVPQPSANGAPGVGATWVGIGGVNSHDLIQAGTQDVASSTNQSEYQTWIETLPQASRQVPLAVAPGDSVTVSITESAPGSGVWQIDFNNNTTGKSYQTTVNYTSTESSAEWVEEAPVGNGGLLPLDNFSSVTFSQATATQNGQTVTLAQSGAQPITMVNGSGQALAVPSAISSDGSSFSVARTSASATPAPSRSVRPAAPPALVLN